MTIKSSKNNIKSYVLCSGVQYGFGEKVFYECFKQAWLQQPAELEIYGDGRNKIPTIHVKDLAAYVDRIICLQPTQKYYFLVDQTKNPTQKSIISAISAGLGSGKTKFVPAIEAVMGNEYYDSFILDVRVKPSKLV